MPTDSSPAQYADDQAARVLKRLGESSFRQRFGLTRADLEYLGQVDRPTLSRHIRQILTRRLAPAKPTHDGRQTPMRGKPRGHPVFLAQHATATCCRSCLAKWHDMPAGQALTDRQVGYLMNVIERWIDRQMNARSYVRPRPTIKQPSLFADVDSQAD